MSSCRAPSWTNGGGVLCTPFAAPSSTRAPLIDQSLTKDHPARPDSPARRALSPSSARFCTPSAMSGPPDTDALIQKALRAEEAERKAAKAHKQDAGAPAEGVWWHVCLPSVIISRAGAYKSRRTRRGRGSSPGRRITRPPPPPTIVLHPLCLLCRQAAQGRQEGEDPGADRDGGGWAHQREHGEDRREVCFAAVRPGGWQTVAWFDAMHVAML